MHRAAVILGIAAFFSIPAHTQDAALTLDQIVEKHTAALGGAEKLKAIQSVTMTGKASLMGGQMEAPITMKVKRPAFMRMEITFQGKSLVQAFDGTTAWMINPFVGDTEPQKQNAEDTKTAGDDADFIDGSLVDYKAKGNKLELLGKEDVDGNPAYKIKVTKNGGSMEFEYLDAKTFLPVRSAGKRNQQGQEIEYETKPGNFKEVGGVMMPYHLVQNVNGQSMMDLTVEKVEVNTAMDPSIFRMPDKAKEEKKEAPKQ
jgi:outer membrane lipoprotein-sorting protein